MTQTVLGPKGSPRRRWTLLLPLVAMLAFAVLYIAGAQAVNQTGAFELEGNAVSANAPAPRGPADDWDRVCHQVTAGGTDSAGHATGAQCASASNTTGATAVSWVDARTNQEIYTGGGSKDFGDPQDEWLWKPKDTVPDKDTITHSFAARYSLPKSATTCPAPAAATTCEVIFFGSDRFANDGDSQLGFWFFQNKIQTTNTSSQGGFKFSGHHQTGDLLVISDFSNGGTTSNIKVYSWQPTICSKADNGNEDNIPVGGCPAKNLRLESKSLNANCATSAATANSCGIVNAANNTPAPWPFLDKTGNSSFQQGELYEAGLNLSGLGFGNECFASVLAESRSSDSTTAVLKDFVLSNFGECTSGIATTPQTYDAGTDTGTNITADVSIGTAARVAVRDKAVITVNGIGGSFGGSVKFFLCGPLALATTTNCATGGVQIGSPVGGETVSGSGGTATVNSDPATLTSVGRYCWRAEYGGDSAKGIPASSDPKPTGDNSTTECFKVVPVTPTLSTTASADVTLGSSISDTASLSGTAKQPGTDGIGPGGTINATAATQNPAGGSITFIAYGPNNCSTVAMASTSRTVSGDGSYPTAAQSAVSFTPSAVGKYTFVAQYVSPTTNTNGAGPSSCPPTQADGDEEVNVAGSASLATAQNWLPNDTAHITSPSGTTLAGTVTFKLYNDATCGLGGGTQQGSTITKNVVSDADSSPAPTANDRYVSTGNTTFRVTVTNDATAWSWKVSYDDSNLNDPTDKCESTTSFTLSD